MYNLTKEESIKILKDIGIDLSKCNKGLQETLIKQAYKFIIAERDKERSIELPIIDNELAKYFFDYIDKD